MIAIHHREGSYSDKWVEYCELNKIPYKLVDCYSTNIISKLKDCDILMWHWIQNDYKALLFARQLTFSVEKMGIKVFPDTNTCWHFDDKVGQKYLFEAIDAPIIKSYIFYDLASILSWIDKNKFPKVFKLRGGAGSENVELLHSKKEAIKYAKKAFTKGFGINRFSILKDKSWQFKRDMTIKSFLNISKGIGRVIVPNKLKSKLPIEKNYLYIQDFVPNNDSDIRVVVIGKTVHAYKRMTRKGDFRASGSGTMIFDPEVVPKECLKIAFDTSSKLKVQSAAYDFIFLDNKPLIVEISYSFGTKGYSNIPGYWDDKLNWIEGTFTPEYFMIEDLLFNE